MLVHIDFSIFAGEAAEAFGMANDELTFDQAPKVGDHLDVLRGKQLPRDVPGFTGIIKVETVVTPTGAKPVAMLEDVFVASPGDALFLFDFLEEEIGLFVTVWKREGLL